MKRTSILLLLALSTLSSCSVAGNKTDSEQEHLRAAALYEDKHHSKKCSAVFDLMRKKLRVGMTSSEASRTLGDAKWLNEINAFQITVLAGWIPVDFSPGRRAFSILLYPNADNWSNHVVYFSLSVPEGDMPAFTIDDFLKGKVKSDDVKIRQFALCHPGKATNDMGRIEVIPKPDSEQGGGGNSAALRALP